MSDLAEQMAEDVRRTVMEARHRIAGELVKCALTFEQYGISRELITEGMAEAVEILREQARATAQ